MISKIKKYLSLCIALTMLIAFLTVPTAAFADDLTNVNEAQYGVIRVINYGASGKGTGFAVGAQGTAAEYFVTNYHVVEGGLDDIEITITDRNGGIPAQVLKTDAQRDIAILKIDQPLTERHPLVILPTDQLLKGQKVFCLGFPGLSDDFSDGGNTLASTVDDITVTSGTASNTNYQSDGVHYILSDVKVNGGNSGGPMVDEFGQVVGINSALVDTGGNISNNMTLAVTMGYVMDMLDSLGIPYMVGSADGTIVSTGLPETEDGEDAEESEDDNSDAESDEESDEKIDWTTIIIIAAAVLVVGGGIAAAFLLLRKKKKVAASPDVGNDTPTVTIRRSMQVRCEAGPMAGRTVMSQDSVTVGRNPMSCQLAYADGTPGVSREHCRIQIMGDGIYVTDLNSSYGTYVNNQKLAPGGQVCIGSSGIILIGSDKVVISAQIVF